MSLKKRLWKPARSKIVTDRGWIPSTCGNSSKKWANVGSCGKKSLHVPKKSSLLQIQRQHLASYGKVKVFESLETPMGSFHQYFLFWLVVSTDLRNMLVKFGHLPQFVGVKIQKIFELPPTSFFFHKSQKTWTFLIDSWKILFSRQRRWIRWWMGSGRVPSWSKSNCTGPHFRMALTTGAS